MRAATWESGMASLELDHLIERAPIIVPVRANGYNHFVVFRGIGATGWWLPTRRGVTAH